VKRTRIELADIADRNNLLHALWLASRGKRHRSIVQKWLGDPESHIAALRSSILNQTAPLGRFRTFTIHDPKKRTIHAADFCDRVLHHAVMIHAGPVIDRSLVADSYACVPGRGVHAAAIRVQQLLRRYPWFVKVDVKGFFPSIDHAVLQSLLANRFKGEQFLGLLDRTITANGGEPGRGLPIGSLCSQHFANLYLDGADRCVRYMDDLLWWAPCKQSAQESLARLTVWLDQHRHLELHDSSQVNRSSCGVSFCGYRITRHAIRLSRRRKRRYVAARQAVERQWRKGAISDSELQQSYSAVKAITLPADSTGFRQANLVQHPAPVA